MRFTFLTLTLLSGLNVAAAQEEAQDEAPDEESSDIAEERPLSDHFSDLERTSAEALILEPTPEEVSADEEAARALREARRVTEYGPYRRRRRHTAAPFTLSRDRRLRRELTLALDANSLTLPLAMFFGGAAGAVGFGYGAVACHTSEEYDPTVGEVRCTEYTTLNIAFLLLAVACNSITIGGAILLIARGVRRRIAYREYRSQSRLSLNPSGLELRF